jgi:hypothetical protein
VDHIIFPACLGCHGQYLLIQTASLFIDTLPWDSRSGHMLIGHWENCWTLFTSNGAAHVRRWIPVLSSFFWTKFFESCLCATVPLSATNQPQTGNKVNWYYSLVSWREGKGGCGRYQIQLRPSWLRVYCARELEHVSVVWCQYAWCLQNNHDAADWTLTGSNMKILVKRKGDMSDFNTETLLHFIQAH